MVARLLAVAWTLLILGVCWLPRAWMPVREKGPGGLAAIPHLDKLIHGGLFAVFGALWIVATRRPAWVVAGGLALAVVSELGQGTSFVRRDPSLSDTLADAAGLALGVAVAAGIGRRRSAAEERR